MTRVHTSNIAVLAVVLAVLTVAIAPMAVAATPGDTTSGTTIGDQLDDAGDSSDDSSGDGDGSTDSSTTDDGSSSDDSTDGSSGDSTDGSSTSDSSTSDSSTDESTDESTDDSSTDSTSDSSSGDSTDDELLNATSNVSTVSETVLPDGVTGGLSEATGAAETTADTTQVDGADAGTSGTVDFPTLDAGVFGTTTTSTTDDATATIDGGADTLLDETGLVVDAVGVSTTGETTASTRFEPARLDSVRQTTRAFDANSATLISPGDAGSQGSTPLPKGPTTGLALGVGALAAAGVTRTGAVAPGTLSALGSTLGSALTAGLAPVVGRSGTLDRLFRMLAPFRYSRYDDSDPLEHDARSDVYDVVNDAPGAYLSEVAEEADLPLSTARHHIRVLEREELVSGAKVRGKRRFYPAYTQGIELAAALNDEATAAVIDAVARFGAVSVSDLANELGRDPSTVSHHLKRLAEDDIIVRERDGRAVMNKLSAEARTALDPGHDSPATEAGEAMASD